MKRFLLSAFAMLLAVTASAQSFAKSPVRLDVQKSVVVNNGAHKAPAKAALANNQRLLGLYCSDDVDAYIGATGLTGNNPVAINLEKEDLKPYLGAKVVGLRFNIAASCSASNVFVKDIAADGSVSDRLTVTKAFTSPAGAQNTGTWHTVMFDAKDQFELSADNEGFFVGYTYNQTSKNYPIGMNTDAAGEFYMYANIPASQGGSGEAWYSMGTDYGALAVQLIVESNNFAANAVQPSDFGSFTVALGKTKKVAVKVVNIGLNLTDFDYTITQEGKTSAEKHVALGQNYAMGSSVTVDIPFEAASKVGEFPVTLTITKVNGEKNGSAVTSAEGKNVTLAKEFVKRSVVEQFTGTGCGYCPRGHVAMHNFREMYGDQFIGIALHQYNSTDPMYNTNYNLGFKGAPSAMVNRDGNGVDPYYNTPAILKESFNDLPVAEVTVSGVFNEDGTEVEAKASVESLVSGDYQIAYMLTADGLTGTTNSWKQANYFSSAYGYFTKNQLPEDLQFLSDEGKTYFETFNDVLIASSYASSKNKATLPTLVEGGTVESAYTLTMPTKTTLLKAIDNDKVYVVAVLLDPTSGAILNAGKAKVAANPTGIEYVNGTTESTVVAYYTTDGVKVAAPVKGVNILKMSDGTTRKVIVK